MKKTTRKKNRTGPLRKWVSKANKKMSGGFISLIVAGLIALGVSSANAALAASVAAPIISGALVASGGVIVNKIAGGGKNKSESAVIKKFLDSKVKQALTTGSISGGSKCRPKLTHRRAGHRLS